LFEKRPKRMMNFDRRLDLHRNDAKTHETTSLMTSISMTMCLHLLHVAKEGLSK